MQLTNHKKKIQFKEPIPYGKKEVNVQIYTKIPIN